MWKTKHGITVYQLLGGRSNVFLVSNPAASLLVDTSWKHARPRLQASLDGFGFNHGRSLSALFLTHAHFDHAENVAWVHERYQPHLIIQEAEAGFLRTGDSPLPAGTNSYTRFLLSRFGKFARSFTRYPPACPEITFADRMDLRDLGFDGYLLHTPGHTKGSSSLIVSDEIAIVGDTMHSVFPNSAYPPFADETRLLIESWKKLLDTGCMTFLPSHGKAINRMLLEREFFKRRLN
jgi:glyoxylase-like metal-dependent hydrolase (beta-lactamase superfamily II)